MQLRADELVRAAMAAAGIGSPAELAKVLGLTAYDSPKRVSRWLRGENKPRFDETIALLELSGWLSVPGEEERASLDAARGAQALAEGEEPRRDESGEHPQDERESA